MSGSRVKVACIVVFILVRVWISHLEPSRVSGMLSTSPPTPYIHYRPSNTPRGRVLIVHGLDVSKETMWLVSTALADGGFETYSIDLPGHGDSPVAFETALAEQVIRNALSQFGGDTIVLGHSLGAGLLLDLAESERFSTMVLLSPPPLAVSRIQAERVLIATGRQDLPRISRFLSVAADIGGANVDSWALPWAGHSAPIRSPRHIRRIVQWLGGDGSVTKTLDRMVWISLLFASAVILGISLMPGRRLRTVPQHIPTLLAKYVMASGLALAVLWVVNPMAWIRFFATDYLVGFVLLTGSILLALERGYGNKETRKSETLKTFLPHCGKSLLAAAFVIVILGLAVASNLLHMSLASGRWWRFPAIFLAGMPLFFFDELRLRGALTNWKSAALALITRLIFLSFLLTGVLVLNREKAFLVLILPLVVLFWLALWLATGVVHRHTQDPVSAALFSAVVQGWAFAAWFVII